MSKPPVALDDAWQLDPSEFPARLGVDPKPPRRVYGVGDRTLLDDGVARVAMVGARRCTSYGRDLARRFGRELAAAGVSVVSGLAYGIDAASHEGALEVEGGAPPIGVVATGLDVVYPKAHRALWVAVGKRGCLISESDFGIEPEEWRFPKRNRIIAALADIVLVVEAHFQSGTRHTVEAAIARGVPVMAVPGPVGSRASEGANQLLREGCAPACELDDILTALGLELTGGHGVLDTRTPPEPRDEPVLAALDWSPTGLETLLRRTAVSPPELTASLYRLLAAGWARSRDGWWERVAAPGKAT